MLSSDRSVGITAMIQHCILCFFFFFELPEMSRVTMVSIVLA